MHSHAYRQVHVPTSIHKYVHADHDYVICIHSHTHMHVKMHANMYSVIYLRCHVMSLILFVIMSSYRSWCTILCGGSCDGECERIGTSQSIQCVLLTGNRSGVICNAIYVYCYIFITSVFCCVDADPTTQVSDLNYDSKNRILSWRPIPLINAHHFFSYLLSFTPRSQDCDQNPPTKNVRYTHCNDTCFVQLNLTCIAGYTVTVTISDSSSPGVSSKG